MRPFFVYSFITTIKPVSVNSSPLPKKAPERFPRRKHFCRTRRLAPTGFDEAGAVFVVSFLGLGFEEGADLEGELWFRNCIYSHPGVAAGSKYVSLQLWSAQAMLAPLL